MLCEREIAQKGSPAHRDDLEARALSCVERAGGIRFRGAAVYRPQANPRPGRGAPNREPRERFAARAALDAAFIMRTFCNGPVSRSLRRQHAVHLPFMELARWVVRHNAFARGLIAD